MFLFIGCCQRKTCPLPPVTHRIYIPLYKNGAQSICSMLNAHRLMCLPIYRKYTIYSTKINDYRVFDANQRTISSNFRWIAAALSMCALVRMLLLILFASHTFCGSLCVRVRCAVCDVRAHSFAISSHSNSLGCLLALGQLRLFCFCPWFLFSHFSRWMVVDSIPI